MISLVYVIPILLCPIFGKMIDKSEYRLKFIIISTTLLLISYITLLVMLLLLQDSPNYSYFIIVPIFAIGVSYSLYAVSIWILVPIIVKPHCIGTAYGLIYSIENIGLSIIPLIIAFIIDKEDKNKYSWAILLFIITSIITFMLSIMLFCFDRLHTKLMNERHNRFKEVYQSKQSNSNNQSTI